MAHAFWSLRRFQHILDKDSLAFSRVVDKDVGDGADEFTVLDNGTS